MKLKKHVVQGKVVLRIGFVADSLPFTVTTQESATKPILKTTLVQGAYGNCKLCIVGSEKCLIN